MGAGSPFISSLTFKLGATPFVQQPTSLILEAVFSKLPSRKSSQYAGEYPDSTVHPVLPMLDTTPAPATPKQNYNGVFALLVINLVIFLLDHPLGLPLEVLYLNHANPAWYQFVTSMFCHANWTHLSSNLFMLYVFGRLVEEEEGILGVVGSYLITGLAANLLSWILQPGPIVSLGASGAVFGLFAVSVLIRLKWNWRSLIEALILGQFVVAQVLSEVQQVGVADGINRIAHLGGALAGVGLVVVLMRLAGNDPTKPKG